MRGNGSLLRRTRAISVRQLPSALFIDLAPTAAEIIAQFFQAVLLRQGACAHTRCGRLQHEPLLAVKPPGLFDRLAVFLQQLVAFLDVKVRMINAAVQVKRSGSH